MEKIIEYKIISAKYTPDYIKEWWQLYWYPFEVREPDSSKSYTSAIRYDSAIKQSIVKYETLPPQTN